MTSNIARIRCARLQLNHLWLSVFLPKVGDFPDSRLLRPRVKNWPPQNNKIMLKVAFNPNYSSIILNGHPQSNIICKVYEYLTYLAISTVSYSIKLIIDSRITLCTSDTCFMYKRLISDTDNLRMFQDTITSLCFHYYSHFSFMCSLFV